jgi:hypothetical protein
MWTLIVPVLLIVLAGVSAKQAATTIESKGPTIDAPSGGEITHEHHG